MSDFPSLSTSLHGFQCNRGELWLSDEECAVLSERLAGYGFCFLLPPSSSAETVSSGSCKRRKTATHEPVTEGGEPGAGLRPRARTRGRQIAGAAVVDQAMQQFSCSSENSSDILFDREQSCSNVSEFPIRTSGSGAPPTVSSKSQDNSVADQTIPNAETSGVKAVLASTPPTKSASRSAPRASPRAPLPCRVTRRRRREILNGDWVEACLHVTELLEKEPASQWFLTPVDPSSAFLHDYLEKVSCPMDLRKLIYTFERQSETIRQKLIHRMYSHPFRWQEDVRTIFYNAFTYYEPGNLIWSNACFLAGLFERLCRVSLCVAFLVEAGASGPASNEFADSSVMLFSVPVVQEHEGVNPYAIYAAPASARRGSEKYSTSSSPIPPGAVGSSPRTTTGVDDLGHLAASADITSSISAGHAAAGVGKNNTFSRSETIVLEASKLRELLEKAATVAQQGILKDGVLSGNDRHDEKGKWRLPSDLGLGCGKGVPFLSKLSQRAAHHRSAQKSRHQSPKHKSNSASSSSSLGDGVPQPQTLRSLPKLPPATLPPPPPPPLITTMRPGDRIPNLVHRRLVSAQFRQLDVHLRKAALELIKDELGIVPATAAADIDFKVDLEILSFLKQKQFLTYLRALDLFQRKRVEEGYSVTLVSQLETSRQVNQLSSGLTPPTTSQKVVNSFQQPDFQNSVSTPNILLQRTNVRAQVSPLLDKSGDFMQYGVKNRSAQRMDLSDRPPDSASNTNVFTPTTRYRATDAGDEDSSSSSSTFSSSSSFSSNEDEDSSTSLSSSEVEPSNHFHHRITADPTSTPTHTNVVGKHLSNAHSNTTPAASSCSPRRSFSSVNSFSAPRSSNKTDSERNDTPYSVSTKEERHCDTSEISESCSSSTFQKQGATLTQHPPSQKSNEKVAFNTQYEMVTPLSEGCSNTNENVLTSQVALSETTSTLKQEQLPSFDASSLSDDVFDNHGSPASLPDASAYMTKLTPDENTASAHGPSSSSSLSSSYEDTNNFCESTLALNPKAAFDNDRNEGVETSVSDNSLFYSDAQIPASSSISNKYSLWEDVIGPTEGVASSWGEWKAKVIQQKIQTRIGDEINQAFLVTGDHEGERAAELADAEI